MSFQRPLQAAWVNCPRSCSPTQHFAACSETLIGDRVSNSAPPIKIRLSERGSLDAPSSGQARFGNRCARRAATRPKLILRRLLSMLKFGPVPPSGDRLQRGFQPASSLFSYEATQNRMQDPRIPKKVLTHNNVRPPYGLLRCASAGVVNFARNYPDFFRGPLIPLCPISQRSSLITYRIWA